jgi:hypothetical protein
MENAVAAMPNDHSIPDTKTSDSTEPSATALKAAYRLMKAMNNSADPPTLDTLAIMLDSELRYSDAIDLISEAAVHFEGDGQMRATADVFQAFVTWARS